MATASVGKGWAMDVTYLGFCQTLHQAQWWQVKRQEFKQNNAMTKSDIL